MGKGMARQQQLERLLARIVMSKRAGDWRDQKERESRDSESGDPVDRIWDSMPRVAKDFLVDGMLPDSSGPEVCPTDEDPESSGGYVDDLPIF